MEKNVEVKPTIINVKSVLMQHATVHHPGWKRIYIVIREADGSTYELSIPGHNPISGEAEQHAIPLR